MQAVPSDGTTPDLIAIENDSQGNTWARGLTASGQQLWHVIIGGTGGVDAVVTTMPDEWRGSGTAVLHVHHSDDEAWHILDGELTFRYSDRTETAIAGKTVFVAAGVAHTYTAAPGARYLIILTPRLSGLIAALQSDRDPTHQHEIYRRFDSDLLE